ncbi:MAG TPA: hypothetical protein VJM82_06620 [Nitrospiraceae bacterium]|nr:hypothetical protein [Nitrospiraceae bacterium]
MNPVVPKCSLCRRVRDDGGTEAGQGTWSDLRGFLIKYDIRPIDVDFSQTFCPECDQAYRNALLYGTLEPLTVSGDAGS